MQERLKRYGTDALNRWNGLEKGQRVRLGLTIVILVISLTATIYMMTRPQWETLVSGKNFTEISQIQNVLTAEGINTRLSNNSTAIQVEKRNLDTALMAVGTSSAISSVDFTFADALAASGMGSTETVKTKSFERLAKSDLEQKLEAFDWVESAAVEIVFPNDAGYWLKSSTDPTAAVTLKVKYKPDDEQAINIARYVCRSVEGLTMDNIEIYDQYADNIYSGIRNSTGGSGTEVDVERLRKTELDAQVRKVLTPIYDEVKTIITLTMDWNKSSQTSVEYSPPIAGSEGGALLERDSDKSSVVNGNPDEEPGVNANDMQTETYQTGDTQSSSASSQSSSERYIFNETHTTTEMGGGNVVYDSSAIAVYVYKYKNHYERQMTEETLNGLTWEEYCDTVPQTPIEVDQNIVDSLRTATRMPQLTVIGFEVPVFHDYVADPIPVEQYIIFAILALLILLLAYGLIRKTQPDEVVEMEPELSVEDLLVSTQLEEAKEEEAAEKLKEIDLNMDSEEKMQIEKIISERPESVAQLLRNWLSEDWE